MYRNTCRTSLTYTSSLRKVLCARNGLILNLVYMFVVGCFYAVATFLSQLLPQWSRGDPRETQIGALGIMFVMGGVVGSTVTGVLLDKKYCTFHQMTIGLLIGSFLSMVLFTGTVYEIGDDISPSKSSSGSHVVIFAVTGVVGCFFTSVVSVGFEYGTDLAKPANEAVVGGIYNVFAQTGGCILVFVGGKIFEQGSGGNQTSHIVLLNGLLSGALLIAGILYVVGIKKDKNE